MKKSLAIILLIAVLGLTFTGCNQTSAELTLTAVWNGSDHNYEKFTYKVTSAEDEGVSGEFCSEVMRIFNTDVSVGDRSYSAVTGDLVINSLTFGDTLINETVLFGAANTRQRLTPFASFRTVTDDNGEGTLSAVYSDNYCTLYINGAEKTKLSLSAPYYDNAQLYTILRTAGEKVSLKLSVPIASEGKAVELSCAALSSTEDVTVPYSGEAIKCYCVSVSRNETLTGTPIYLYFASGSLTADGIAVKNPLLKIVEGNIVYELKSISTEKI